MGDDDDAATAGRLLAQQLEDLDAGLEVELAGRLVGEQHRVAGRDGARDRHALLLTAGELVAGSGRGGIPARRARSAATARGAAAAPGDGETELDVLQRGQPREQVEGLEDEGDRLAAEAEQLSAEAPVMSCPAITARPAVGESRAPIDVQERRLAAAGGPEDDDELVRRSPRG